MESSITNAAGRMSLSRWVARVLAVLAVAGTAIALVLVISGSTESDEKAGSSKGAGQRPPREQRQETPDNYVVQPGDSLGSIAVKVGVPVDRIEKLNPDIDPQALPSGATLELP